MDGGQWTPSSRNHYNLRDAIARCTTQVRELLEEEDFYYFATLDARVWSSIYTRARVILRLSHIIAPL